MTTLQKKKLRRGFTAIEVILTMGTVALATGLSVPMYRQYVMRNDLEIARQNVAQGMQRARFLSQVAMNDSSWGYSTDAVPGRGVLFMGNNYATRNTAFDEMYSIPNTVSVTGITEVVFEKITGNPLQVGTITLTALSGEQRSITINLGEEGNVSIPEDWLTICKDPYSDNPTTIQVPDSLLVYYQSQGAIVGECGSGPICGNGIVQEGETCDDGNTTSGDGCDSSCYTEECGNNVVQIDEDCDDGGESSSCNTDCTYASCGDSKENTTAGEDCDDGGESASCNVDCTSHSCGDGTLNVTAGEDCDGGGETVSCDTNCTVASCGDSTVNATAGEECDDGGESASCNSNCTNSSCGDSVLNITDGEECDDGNTTPGDGCDASCQNEPQCGNGSVEGDEQCDDGNTTPGDGCDASCKNEVCGNSIVQSGEDCDDGGESATCDSNCTNQECGDSTVNSTAGEECDDGNTTNNDGCSSVCLNEVCGDSIVQTSEQCDDGNTTPGDGCDASCQTEGGGGGGGGGPDFEVDEDDTVTVTDEFTCTAEVIGASMEAFGYKWPITVQLEIGGSTIDPYGDFTLPVDSTVNDGNTHTYSCGTYTPSPSTDIDVTARSWDKKSFWYDGSENDHFQERMTVDTSAETEYVVALVDGDPVPEYDAFGDQASAADFLEPYIDFDTDTISINDNEVIYLFELYTTNLESSTADFQDLVMIISLDDA